MNWVGAANDHDTDIVIYNGQPAICYRDLAARSSRVARRTGAGQWTIENVSNDASSGEFCEIDVLAGALVTAFSHGTELRFANRQANGSWTVTTVDTVGGRTVGVDPSMVIRNGVPYIAHQDETNGLLRLSRRLNGRWTTVATPAPGDLNGDGLPDKFGFRPGLVVLENDIRILHGLVPAQPDQGSDYSLRISVIGHDLAAFQTSNLQATGFGGGQAVMAYEEGFLGAVRRRDRDAVFGSRGGLYLVKAAGNYSWNPLEFYDGGVNHTYRRISIEADPFGLPLIGFADLQQGDEVCVYRPNDADRDQLPDVEELRRGTDPDRADTDGDGVSDGDEVFNGTDPLAR